MRKLIYLTIALLAVFSILRARAQEREHSRFTMHPSLVEFTGRDSRLSIGFGLIESDGERTKVWNVFPLRLELRSGDESFYLALNGVSFLTRSGINFGKELSVKQIHRGDVISVGGPVVIHERVEGNVWTFGADISIMPNAEVTGDVVAIGGEIEVQDGAVVRGNKQSLPQLSIPFLGFLTSPQSAETLLFVMDIFGVLLFILVLFLLVHFKRSSLVALSRVVTENWKGSLLYLFLAIIVLPLLVALLIASVVGIFLVPVLLITVIVLTYFGFAGASARLGQLFIGGSLESPVKVYLGGLLGFFIVRIPSLLGRFLSLLSSEVLIYLRADSYIVGRSSILRIYSSLHWRVEVRG